MRSSKTSSPEDLGNVDTDFVEDTFCILGTVDNDFVDNTLCTFDSVVNDFVDDAFCILMGSEYSRFNFSSPCVSDDSLFSFLSDDAFLRQASRLAFVLWLGSIGPQYSSVVLWVLGSVSAGEDPA
mmetsp:Transcript_117922/g.176155  ORF Transcript_117922/g.176155 Transcript_117922/m.176155 type:complete len:125 (+) Transcript_117922:470-844(+)